MEVVGVLQLITTKSILITLKITQRFRTSKRKKLYQGLTLILAISQEDIVVALAKYYKYKGNTNFVQGHEIVNQIW